MKTDNLPAPSPAPCCDLNISTIPAVNQAVGRTGALVGTTHSAQAAWKNTKYCQRKQCPPPRMPAAQACCRKPNTRKPSKWSVEQRQPSFGTEQEPKPPLESSHQPCDNCGQRGAEMGSSFPRRRKPPWAAKPALGKPKQLQGTALHFSLQITSQWFPLKLNY